ncbi:hypothetical protein PQ455_07285 [Sphingomonas naphthae]|uniref:Uncharacterized protein n=1 Tax=Sphingomonas naphthae TaxID=1813468 RepID=A0ABY7TQQ6_9SPHN|nr:hypothetical protein [Sphingomonas naphthae]WCT75011.1 hypothetical protein PQ455_07285 [Sphingomonas naphthae]
MKRIDRLALASAEAMRDRIADRIRRDADFRFAAGNTAALLRAKWLYGLERSVRSIAPRIVSRTSGEAVEARRLAITHIVADEVLREYRRAAATAGTPMTMDNAKDVIFAGAIQPIEIAGAVMRLLEVQCGLDLLRGPIDPDAATGCADDHGAFAQPGMDVA